MSKKRIIISAIFFVAVIACLLTGIFLTNDPNHVEEETIQEVMKEAVLHEHVKVSLFGLKDVNPALISAFIVTAIILVVALVLRIFFIRRFKLIPDSKIQIAIESLVGLFDGTSKSNSPHKYKLLRVYMFVAATYIFVSTVFELLGVQVTATNGKPITLSAPLADINGAIMLGATTYTFILLNGLFVSGIRGFFGTLKDFSLPISMSLRLFGALLVTELVYYYRMTSFVIPVFVAIAFTLMHAIIQAYVLTMLLSIFYGEATEEHEKKEKKEKKNKNKNQKTLVSEVQ